MREALNGIVFRSLCSSSPSKSYNHIVNDRQRPLTSLCCNIVPNVKPPCNIVVIHADGVVTRKNTRLNIFLIYAFFFKFMHANCYRCCCTFFIEPVGVCKVSLFFNLPSQSSIFFNVPPLFLTFKQSFDC